MFNKEEQWNAQPENAYQEILRKSGNIHNKKWMSLLVFGIAVFMQGLFFFYISTDISSKAFRGLEIMAGTLVIRLCIEFAMIKKRSFPVEEARTHSRGQLTSYYKTRKYMLFMVAPLLLIAYFYGFLMLLSTFEQELTSEFYSYTVNLSWAVFSGLAVLIGIQSKKELQILKSLIKG